jgi:hypothetical protein
VRQPVAHGTNAETFMRMAETLGLPFTAQHLSDEWIPVTIGTAAEQGA